MDAKHPLVSGIEWILEHRKGPTGRPLSMRGLSLQAGLSGGHIEQILKGRINPAAVAGDVLQKIADAGGVTVAWLTGEGRVPPPPASAEGRARYVEREDLYPTRPVAIAILRGKGCPDWALDALLAIRRDGDVDPGLEGKENWFTIARDILRYGAEWSASMGGENAGDFRPKVGR